MNQAVEQWLEAHRDELVADISRICAVNSVKGACEEGKPFGPGPFEALELALSMCEGYGFEIKNYDNYVGTADLAPGLARGLDILAHLDVVPPGDGWTVTQPFEPRLVDGKLYARGSSDDKGPAFCALYAMRAVKACGIPLRKGVRMILGTDEECGSSDIPHYYREEAEAEMTFSPDAEFPLINVEKGAMPGTISRQFEECTRLPRVLEMQAGMALNAVPGKAVLRFEGLDMQQAQAFAAKVTAETGVSFEQSGEQELTAYGKSAHASTPEGGRNALLASLMLLERLPLADCEQRRALTGLLKLFPYGVTDGRGLGIQMSDEVSHALTCTLDLLHADVSSLEAKFDSRVPVSATEENCLKPAKAQIEAAGYAFSTPGMRAAHVVPEDSEFVRTLLSVYEAQTGLPGECIAIGGGTYVHELSNGVAFGAQLPGEDTNMHGPNEYMRVETMLTAAKIYAEAIVRLCS